MGERRGLKYVWRTGPRAPSALFEGVADLHPALVQVLFARGFDSVDGCLDFLAGVCRDSDDPNLFADLPRAVERLVQARERGERVAVFTDYDADGVNAAAVLATGLRMLGIDPLVRLPNRFVDGYGLSEAAVAELAERGAQVIITADCGSSSHAAADLARRLGVDLLITDHHQCPPELPDAYAVVNPWRPDCRYPFDYLCGAGMAFKLLQALADALHREGRAAMEPLLDLVALATVADVMPLVGENRRLVMRGLEIMNAFPRPGVRALIDVAGLRPGEVDAAALGFGVAPRVNAAGRLEDPSVAYRLLMSETYDEAYALARQVDLLNQERRKLTRDLEQQAAEIIQPRVQAGAYSLVCGGEGWPQGILGLVAGRLAQTHCRPALVYTVKDGVAHGSGRSIPGFDLLAALRACDDVFERYGGHRAAAGFALPASRVDELVERFEEAARTALTPELLQPVLQLDAYLKPETISFDFVRAIERLAPFGTGFRLPTFGVRNLRVVDSRLVGGDGQHWKVRLRPTHGGTSFDAIAFGNGAFAERFRVGSYLDAALTLERSQYNGQWRIDMKILDVAASNATA
jgi:single-stranded-DNA-specific exonuclease